MANCDRRNHGICLAGKERPRDDQKSGSEQQQESRADDSSVRSATGAYTGIPISHVRKQERSEGTAVYVTCKKPHRGLRYHRRVIPLPGALVSCQCNRNPTVQVNLVRCPTRVLGCKRGAGYIAP